MTLRKVKILIVDDEKNIREVIKEYSTLEGYEVMEADSGSKALELLNTNKFDLMILDIMMPKMDGFTLLNNLPKEKILNDAKSTFTEENYQKFKTLYNEYKDNIIDAEYEYLDIVPKHVTKYDAIQQLSHYLNIQNEEVMAVGDNINDIEMIKHAGIGVAIGGSYKRVQNVASYVTKNTVKTGGFAEAVNKFIKEKRSENVYSRRI